MKQKIISLVAILFTLLISCSNPPPPVITAPPKEEHTGPITASEAHLGEDMGHMEYYMLKLGLALQNKNVPLAKFYVQEVNEVAGELSKKNIVDENFEISNLIASLLLPQTTKLATMLDSNSTSVLYDQYKNVITNCNSCHTATKHEFIVIEEPTQAFNGQKFAPKNK